MQAEVNIYEEYSLTQENSYDIYLTTCRIAPVVYNLKIYQ